MEAKKYLEEALKKTSGEDKREKANILSHYGNALRLNGNIKEAEIELSEAWNIFESLENHSRKC